MYYTTDWNRNGAGPVGVMTNLISEPRREKTNVLVSDMVRHKPGCTATEDSWKLEISDLGRRGIALSM